MRIRRRERRIDRMAVVGLFDRVGRRSFSDINFRIFSRVNGDHVSVHPQKLCKF